MQCLLDHRVLDGTKLLLLRQLFPHRLSVSVVAFYLSLQFLPPLIVLSNRAEPCHLVNNVVHCLLDFLWQIGEGLFTFDCFQFRSQAQ